MVERSGRRIREMFSSIAPTYDLLNRVLSFSVDRYWRRRTRKCLEPHVGADSRILDLCCGTGDLALELSSIAPVIGCDFVHSMLTQGIRKSDRHDLKHPIRFVEGDALHLPFPDSSFHAVSIAFGLRNLENYGTGLREMARVLEKGGRLVVLEFSEPRSRIFGAVYRFYFEQILPRVGALISGNRHAYSYLPESVRGYPASRDLVPLFLEAGFSSVDRIKLTGGISDIHFAVKTS